MAVELKHRTVATVEPSGEHEIDSPQWNENHVLTMATGRILGRTASGTGEVQEISAGTGITLSGLTISFNSTWGDGRYALSGHDHTGVYEPAFAKNTAFNKNFGNAAGTVTEGNDARLSNARDWTASVVSQGEAEAGTATTARKWTAQRVRQAIAAWWSTITLTKSDVGLGNVDNTSDANKPVSTATQAALDGKLSLTGGTLSGPVIFPDSGVALRLPNIGSANPAGTVSGDVWIASNTIRFNSNGTIRTLAHTNQWSLVSAAELETGTATTPRLISAERLQTKLTSWWAGSDAKVSLDTVVGWGNHNTAGYLTSVSWSDVGSKPATATRWPTFAEVTNKPADYPPSPHSHAIGDVTGLSAALTAKRNRDYTVTIAGGGPWQTSAYLTYVAIADTELVLPASPAEGEWVGFVNAVPGTQIEIKRNGQKIMGLEEDMTVDLDFAGFELMFTTSQGWIAV